ncbi:hypothetical protein DCAR_0312369 [Daucus carota subsp. sativus]|uniref:BED-type domain-containing protein n=1 Tax=Daucus carota subsp. sativus TaxID=79200 RepID=A0AAF1AS07_DAUCS|nr:hypothetical protein DCAR_0312369 [Daucus carota subsp. sativus]
MADESLSEEDVEQEELSQQRKSHKDVAADMGSNGPEEDQSVPESINKPFQRKPRKKTSSVWNYMETFKANGVEGSRCKLCSQQFTKSESSSTSSMKRHLDKCLKAHGATLQPQLQFHKGLGNDVQFSAFKYDHAIIREKVSHYIMINELPFVHVESFMWNEIMKTATPLYQKITRGTLKGDCRTTYEIEKKKLVELFKSAQRINITTDMWTSTCQKLGYMVVTAHWIDENWKLNSRVINFCNIPPPHFGYVISDAVNKCLVDWKIQDKIGTVTVDNAKANDVAIKILKESFSIRNPSLPVEGKLFHVRCVSIGVLETMLLCSIVDIYGLCYIDY